MRPVLLVTLEYPPQIGGIAEYLRRVTEQFPAGAVEVLAPERPDAHDADMSSAAAIFRGKLEWPKLRPRWLPALFRTWQLARKRDSSFLLVSHLLPMGTVARLVGRWLKIPYGVIVHGTDLHMALAAHGRKRQEAERILREARYVIANSAYTANLVTGMGVIPDRLLTVRPCPSFPPETVADEVAAHKLRVSLGVAESFMVLSVGRLVARKDFATAIRAVAELRSKGYDVRHVIVGDGADRPELEKAAKEAGIEKWVVFAGAVPAADLPNYFAAADAFVMVPKSGVDGVEGFGIVYLEANLMGRPVIGSRSAGVPDAVVDGKTGLLVNPGDVQSLALAIRSLIDDRSFASRLGLNGRERVLEAFTWRRQAAPLVEALTRYFTEKR